MGGGWLISEIVQWVLLGCMGIVLLAHSRLLGLLHLRLGPSGARPLADGPPLRSQLGTLAGKRLDGSAWTVSFPRQTETILIFVSPQCETCNALLPHVKDFVRARPDRPVTLVSTVDHVPMNRAYIAYRNIEELPYVLGEKLSEQLDIEGTPYALRIDGTGTVVAKGIVNTFENLVLFSEHEDAPKAATGPVRTPQVAEMALR